MTDQPSGWLYDGIIVCTIYLTTFTQNKGAKMLKRALYTVLACLLLVGGVPAGVVNAHNTSSTTTDSADLDIGYTGESRSDPIWSGLWAGANLDIGSVFSSTNNREDTAEQRENQSGQSDQSSQSRKKPATTKGTYVALGDSVAAGLGLTMRANASEEDIRCGRSQEAYGYIVAQSLRMKLRHYACSGATAGDLYTVQRSGSPNVQPQLDAAFATGTPSLITITAGANDADWADFISKCYALNCNNEALTLKARGHLAVVDYKLHRAFNEIKRRSGSDKPPQVIVTGYYNPLSDACTKIQDNITKAEIKWLSDQSAALNRTIRSAAGDYSFVRFAPVDFSGHDICSTNPWIQGLSSEARFHPTSEGQRAIAKSVLRTMRS